MTGTSSPSGGWGFAGAQFRNAAVLNGLHIRRMRAYDDAAEAEAMVQAANTAEHIMAAKALRDHHYDEAALIEAEIASVMGGTEQ